MLGNGTGPFAERRPSNVVGREANEKDSVTDAAGDFLRNVSSLICRAAGESFVADGFERRRIRLAESFVREAHGLDFNAQLRRAVGERADVAFDTCGYVSSQQAGGGSGIEVRAGLCGKGCGGKEE